MKRIISKLYARGEGLSEDYRLETAIECYRIRGSRLFHGVEVVTRKIIDRAHSDGTTYSMDYGAISIRHRVLFDKPRREGTLVLSQEFEIACQKVMDLMTKTDGNVMTVTL